MTQINMAALRRGSSATSQLDAVKAQLTKLGSNGFEKDVRFWQPTVDQSGTGGAVIRFMPAATEGEFPMVKVFSHGFKVNNKWFIEDCPMTIGSPCPVCEAVDPLWNIDKDTAKSRAKNTSYIANIYIVKDPAKPENNGKVFLFKFGKKILDKLNAAMSGDSLAGVEPVNPFSFFEGANLALKLKKVAGFRNYDDSVVISTGDFLNGDEAALTNVLKSCYSLAEFHSADKFKSYADLKQDYERKVNSSSVAPTQTQSDAHIQSSPVVEHSAPVNSGGGDVDADLAFFQSLTA